MDSITSIQFVWQLEIIATSLYVRWIFIILGLRLSSGHIWLICRNKGKNTDENSITFILSAVPSVFKPKFSKEYLNSSFKKYCGKTLDEQQLFSEKWLLCMYTGWLKKTCFCVL